MTLKAIILSFSVLTFTLTSSAQNLPSIQKEGMKAPVLIDVDGNSNEWKNFQAYNKSTEVFYSIANDNNKLYLCIKAASSAIVKKIIGGGITLTINPLKKSEIGAVAITYPMVENAVVQRIADTQKGIKIINHDNRDSLVNLLNKQITQQAKIIKISGIEQMTDSLISIYNTHGVKTRSQFDIDGNYIYEVSIDVKYIKQQAKAEGFYYNIKLNGFQPNLAALSASQITKIVVGATSMPTIIGKENYQAMGSPTDFWGHYVLYK